MKKLTDKDVIINKSKDGCVGIILKEPLKVGECAEVTIKGSRIIDNKK